MIFIIKVKAKWTASLGCCMALVKQRIWQIELMQGMRGTADRQAGIEDCGWIWTKRMRIDMRESFPSPGATLGDGDGAARHPYPAGLSE
jgi:hypothetical protein